eukprot:TRINITY_DN1269_c0_g2_i1.p1 TRINITY_DN1269_c0_g2~~TRINITY_DN1269_c0_g2_i1.p1  ORF type:complete len:712 (-),score=137.06 TRINITY_DN1269_c0_g2_i1:94-2199(-)
MGTARDVDGAAGARGAQDAAAEKASPKAASEDVQVICVGLMRTGLQSLHKALDILGYENIYDQDKIVTTYELWDDVLKNRDARGALRKIFVGADVIMGLPTFCFWEDILALYPNARVILTVREEDGWWTSVRRAKEAMDNEVPGAPLRYGSLRRKLEKFLVPSYHKFCEVLRFAWATTLGATGLQGGSLNESVTRGSFRQHNAYVKSLLGDRRLPDGSPQLLVFDVRRGWEPLCTFLAREVPREAPFPSVMTVPYFPDGVQRPDWVNRVTGFDELFAPDSEFGIRMRQELLHGLAVSAAMLTVLTVSILAAALYFTKIPATMVALIYLVLLTIGWNAYGVMHRLVMRMPLLLVLPMALKALLIATALHACFISYGVLKEALVTRYRVASPVLVLSSRLMSVVTSAVWLLVTEGRVSLGVPLHAMSAFAFTNEASTWAGYEMLKYVSFPVQVMAKSVKMLPNMLMGRIVNKTRYSFYQYAQAVCALICVAIMHFSDEEAHAETPRGGRGARASGAEDELEWGYKLRMGIAMLCMFFVCDSFTSQWQTALYGKYPNVTQTQMMLGGNVLGLIFTSSTLVAQWPKIQVSLSAAMERPEILSCIVGLGVVSALGQFCIYTAIRSLGSLSFTWIMTARQLLSVLISLIYFGHGINVVKILCIVTVFAIMSAKQLSRVTQEVSKVTLSATRHARRRFSEIRKTSKQS